ncbi:hypothetical protein EDB84DRAFT_1562045 [Lactarius hengduanensis]|nr:hypothetical protein EDB84DRAFT_1562045 [Lactarius hengduanensis]
MTLPSRHRVVAPNLAAPVRGLHYPNQLRFQFRWTLRRSFAPRRSSLPTSSHSRAALAA